MSKKSLNSSILDKFDLSQIGAGWFLTYEDKIYLTQNGNKVCVPNEHFLEILKLELKDHKILESSRFSLIEILISFADKSSAGKGIFVDELIKYLETDLLFYRVTSPKNLADSQSEKWDGIIHIFDSIFQTTWNISDSIMPIQQDPENILKIKDYLMRINILNLHIMTYLLKITGSCIVTVLCHMKKLDVMEAWKSVNIEELWYNKIYNDDEKKAELDRQILELDFYFKLLDSI